MVFLIQHTGFHSKQPKKSFRGDRQLFLFPLQLTTSPICSPVSRQGSSNMEVCNGEGKSEKLLLSLHPTEDTNGMAIRFRAMVY